MNEEIFYGGKLFFSLVGFDDERIFLCVCDMVEERLLFCFFFFLKTHISVVAPLI